MTITRQNELNRLRAEVSRLDLQGRDAVLALTLDELDAAFNGCGPEFLPEGVRQTLDRVTAVFAPAFMVHDVDFTFSDGSEESFKQANTRLLGNCITCANNAYPWTNWRRYALYIQAWAMYRAVSHPKLGWVAWIQAANKRKEKPNE